MWDFTCLMVDIDYRDSGTVNCCHQNRGTEIEARGLFELEIMCSKFRVSLYLKSC